MEVNSAGKKANGVIINGVLSEQLPDPRVGISFDPLINFLEHSWTVASEVALSDFTVIMLLNQVACSIIQEIGPQVHLALNSKVSP